jgi:hypothetical protein
MTPSCGQRNISTVPLQSLALLNSEFARARAEAFARRMEREAGDSNDRRVSLVFQLATGRGPLPDERAAARRFLATQQALYAGQTDGTHAVWTDFCQMILASNVFLYVE